MSRALIASVAWAKLDSFLANRHASLSANQLDIKPEELVLMPSAELLKG